MSKKPLLSQNHSAPKVFSNATKTPGTLTSYTHLPPQLLSSYASSVSALQHQARNPSTQKPLGTWQHSLPSASHPVTLATQDPVFTKQWSWTRKAFWRSHELHSRDGGFRRRQPGRPAESAETSCCCSAKHGSCECRVWWISTTFGYTRIRFLLRLFACCLPQSQSGEWLGHATSS